MEEDEQERTNFTFWNGTEKQIKIFKDKLISEGEFHKTYYGNDGETEFSIIKIESKYLAT